MSFVSAIPAAPSQEAAVHFAHRLALETDCSDVAASMKAGEMDFVLLHVVGSPEAYARRHVPGALHLRHADISAERLAAWPTDTLFVVYCAGPHCNGADRAALKLALLGRPVKVQRGGGRGWGDGVRRCAPGGDPGGLAV